MNLHLGYLPGCIGRVVEMHATYYAGTVGFGAPFEAKVATELSAFCLRWFIASDESRGKGVGALMLGAALAFCRTKAYRRVYLWTFDGLHAARHLYEKHGFMLARTQRGSQWGKEVHEQLFTLRNE